MKSKIIIGTIMGVFLFSLVYFVIRDNKLQKQIDDITRSIEENSSYDDSEITNDKCAQPSGELQNSKSDSEEKFTSEETALSEKEKALEEAKIYLDGNSSSREWLIQELTKKGFTSEQAAYAADNCGVDWNENALKRVESMFKAEKPRSPNEVINLLELQGFTSEEALYAFENCSVNWNEQADRMVKECYEYINTREDLLEILLRDGFTEEQAEYAADANGY